MSFLAYFVCLVLERQLYFAELFIFPNMLKEVINHKYFYLFLSSQSLATELQHNVKEMRTRIRCTKKMQEDKKCGGNISKESVHRAQSLAASILNISKTDLDEILDVVNDEVSYTNLSKN